MLQKLKIAALLFLLPLLLFAEGRDYPQKVEIEGNLINWAWANTKNTLALFIKNNDGHEIRLLDAETLQLSAGIKYPKYLTNRSMEWTADDSGIIFLSDRCIENTEGVAFFDFKTLSFRNDYNFNYINFSSCDQRWSLYYDPQSRCWATLATGEGHPDIKVSRDGESIMRTDVYPGYAGIIGWKDGSLYLDSSLPLKLETGYNNTIYLINELRASDEDISDAGTFIYSLDIESGELAAVESVFLPDFRNTSKSGGSFYFRHEFLEAENKTLITMW